MSVWYDNYNREDKRCKQCKTTKPIEDFGRNKSEPSGVAVYCKACDKVNSSKRYFAMKHLEKYKARKKAYSKMRMIKHPERARAWRLATAHRKELIKPACEGCGETENLHMHHPDYSKPLFVKTVCRDCHLKEHNGAYQEL